MSAVVVGNKNPLYRQVAQILRQRIRTGDYTHQQSLPSVRVLSREMNVSICVVQRAVRLLKQDGILVSHHGKAITVDQAEPCARAAINFGLIQPFTTGMQMHVLHYAEQAFSQRGNFVVTRNSGGDAQKERELAEHLVNNGVQGLLVWSMEESPNGPFFQQLAKRVPVILVDRLIKGAHLPAVVHGMHAGGQDICRHMLQTLKCRRLLALIDRNDLSSYRDLMAGLRDAAVEMGRPQDLTIHRLPLVHLVKQFGRSDFSEADTYARTVQALLDEGYDGLFCPQSDFIDCALLQGNALVGYDGLKIGTISDPDLNQHSRIFCQTPITQWRVGYTQAIATAADLLQQGILLRQRPKGVHQIAMEHIHGRGAPAAAESVSVAGQ